MNKWPIFVGTFVLLNNIYWVSQIGLTDSKQTENNICKNLPENTTQRPSSIEANTSRKVDRVLSVSTTFEETKKTNRTAPNRISEVNYDLADESRDFIDGLNYEKEVFDLESVENQLATIENLATTGSDLLFIKKITSSKVDESVKISALNKLQGQTQYGAVQIALHALESNETKGLSLAALDMLKNTHDISLVPQLKDLEESVKYQYIRQEIDAAIKKLEGGVSMGADDPQ
jgi:hypothetical protein